MKPTYILTRDEWTILRTDSLTEALEALEPGDCIYERMGASARNLNGFEERLLASLKWAMTWVNRGGCNRTSERYRLAQAIVKEVEQRNAEMLKAIEGNA